MEARHGRLEKRINQQGSVRFLNMHQKLLTSSPNIRPGLPSYQKVWTCGKIVLNWKVDLPVNQEESGVMDILRLFFT
ncbi:hypothetical protein AS888_01690 [Peribacillus simplex]|uniref:Uncharacterized protein n=1 Tax=Peribacillus simplex TaxID=1478 RepID=A0A109MSF3_9BACI|nr:hypothetical protein AS888_01690 [Peribacillus simplex]